MAEETAPVESEGSSSPGTTDNESPASDSGSSYDETSSDSSSSTHTTEPLWTRLGYDSEEALENTHTRYKQQVSGSYNETQRLQSEIAARDQRLSDFEHMWQTRQGSGTTGQPPARSDQPLSMAQAFEAYLNSDTDTLARYEQQQARQAEERVLSTLSTVVKPAQYSDMVIQDYPDLNDPKSPLYRHLYDRYEAEAAHPRYKLMFPEQDPTAIREAFSPDGVERKRVDMRLVGYMAPRIAAELARNEGRKDEAKRRGASGGNDAGRSSRSNQSEPSAWQLMSREEQQEIRQQLSSRTLPDDWPKTPEGVADHLAKGWKKRDPKKHQNRVEMFRSGQPIRIG
jgi:hypothetical protein